MCAEDFKGWFCLQGVRAAIRSQALVNHLNAELNPICRLLALLGAHLIFHVSRIRVKSRPHPSA